MAIPDKKRPLMEQFVDKMDTAMFGRTRTGSIRKDICVLCGGPATEFTDEISRKEYTISGSCQKCQDAIFAEEEDEEEEENV